MQYSTLIRRLNVVDPKFSVQRKEDYLYIKHGEVTCAIISEVFPGSVSMFLNDARGFEVIAMDYAATPLKGRSDSKLHAVEVTYTKYLNRNGNLSTIEDVRGGFPESSVFTDDDIEELKFNGLSIPDDRIYNIEVKLLDDEDGTEKFGYYLTE